MSDLDFACNISKLQYKSLAFVADLKRATDEGITRNCAIKSILSPFECFTASKGLNLYILFAITAAGVVACGGSNASPRTSSIVQNIFYLRSFEISKDIQSVQTLTFKNILLSIVKIIRPRLGMCLDLDFRNCSTIVWLSLPV